MLNTKQVLLAILTRGIYAMHLSMCSHRCSVCGAVAQPWHVIYDHREHGQIHVCNDCRRDIDDLYFATLD